MKTNQRFMFHEILVKTMKLGSVIIDISIDQGGCSKTSKITTHSNPVYYKHNVVSYCVPNIASRVARNRFLCIIYIFAPVILIYGPFWRPIPMLKEFTGLRQGVYIIQWNINK